jgi:hypothetical protein
MLSGHFVYSATESNYAILFAGAIVARVQLATDRKHAEVGAQSMSSPNNSESRNNAATVRDGSRLQRDHWREWSEVLRRHRLEGIAAWLLEAGGPLSLISAQLLYVGEPWLGGGAHELARLLESDAESMAFVRYLESGSHDVPESPAGIA